MPPHRLIHPRGHSQKLTGLTDLEFRVWIQYLLSADDFGVMPQSTLRLQSDSKHLAGRKPKELARCLDALVACGLVQSFTHQGDTFLYQRDWQDYQKVAWPSRTTFPPVPPDLLATCTPATQLLFSVHPGAQRVPQVKTDDRRSVPRTPDVLQSTDEVPTEVLQSNPKEPLKNFHGTPASRETLTLTKNADAVPKEGGGEGETAPFDVWTREFLGLYPKQGRCGWHMVERPLYEALTADPALPPAAAWTALKARLSTHIQSARWTEAGGKFIPRADRYLREGTHLQTMAPPSPGGSTAKTAGNHEALTSFVNRHTTRKPA